MTLTADEIDEMAPDIDDESLAAIAAQAKRVPELEAERDRYRKVAEEAHRVASRVVRSYRWEISDLLIALAAVEMKVEE
jgi:hypothetical protein